jgi:hypothetical protein
MINLLNKLLSRFNLQVVFKQEQEPEKEYSLVEASIKFLDTYPKNMLRDYENCSHLHFGNIEYLQDKNKKTYYKDNQNQTYFCDYDLKNPSKEVLGHMIEETTFTQEELEKKLND